MRDIETYLSRDAAAEALTAEGYPVSRSTLARLACYGGGPAFRRFRRRVMYRWGDLLAWAEAQRGRL